MEEGSAPNREMPIADPMHWACTKLCHLQRGRSDDQLFIPGMSPGSGLSPLIIILVMRSLSSLTSLWSSPDPLNFPRL